MPAALACLGVLPRYGLRARMPASGADTGCCAHLTRPIAGGAAKQLTYLTSETIAFFDLSKDGKAVGDTTRHLQLSCATDSRREVGLLPDVHCSGWLQLPQQSASSPSQLSGDPAAAHVPEAGFWTMRQAGDSLIILSETDRVFDGLLP